MRKDKTILVTGGAGFIGSTYLNMAVKKYPEYFFVNVDCLTYAGTLSNIDSPKAPNYKFAKVDIRNIKKLEKIFEKYQPTDIIHFAAETHVDFSITEPAVFVETNVIGTHNLLLLANKYKLNRFHHISTDEVYGALPDRSGSFIETTVLAPNSPYSASKAAADLLVRSYHKTFGLNTVITRSSNNYGPRQDTSKLIPRFITDLLQNKKVGLYGTGANIRDWLYVDDNVQAIDLVFHKGRAGEIYNIGASCEKTNLEVTRHLLNALGKDELQIEYIGDRPGHDFRYSVDTTKIRVELAWQTTHSFDAGLAKTIAWYKKI